MSAPPSREVETPKESIVASRVASFIFSGDVLFIEYCNGRYEILHRREKHKKHVSRERKVLELVMAKMSEATKK
ncbi:MAG: hypothetical protein ACI8ZB_000349 [Desulforhopalus sp.]|jgi:hypothetical protein